MRSRTYGLAALLVVLAAVPIPARPAPATVASALDGHGYVTDRATAERAIGFRPFVPDPTPLEVALIPPFHGDGLSKNEGIAYDYAHRGRAWILQQWPRNGGTLAAFAALPPEPACTDVHAVAGRTHPRGVVWSTPHGMVLSLTPDGRAEPRVILTEFRRLVRLGACR